MALPKRRHSYARTRRRRAHDGLSTPGLMVCQDCGEPKQPHRLCGSCGKYNKKTVYVLDTDV